MINKRMKHDIFIYVHVHMHVYYVFAKVLCAKRKCAEVLIHSKYTLHVDLKHCRNKVL